MNLEHDNELNKDSVLASRTQTMLVTDAHLGPYKIEAKLGAGGMGEVYRATDTRLHRTVAIKVLPHDKVADPERKRRFLQEARAASALNHPNIITLHDISHDGGIDFMVMEYVEGKSLDKLVTPKGLPINEAAGYCSQIASALAAAHAAGIVHRDIKPANVIVTAESQVKVLDFGLAKLMERASGPEGETITQESALTETGTVMGTVGYMSPEQATARPLDPRTDIFSLGVVLYELLAGRRPFRGNSQVETLHAIIHDPAPPLAGVSPWTQDILDKALAKDPKDRYQHAGDVALDLRRSLRAAPSGAVLALTSHRLWLWFALPLLVLTVAAAGWFALDSGKQGDNPLANAQSARFTDFEGSENDAAISRDGRFVVFRSDRDGPVDAWVSQVGSRNFINLTKGSRSSVAVRNAGFTPDGSEIWLSSITGGDRMRLIPSMGGALRPFFSERAFNAAWSPDGSQVVFHSNEPGDPMFVADTSGSNLKQIFALRAGGHNHYPVWSKDGQWIYFVSGIWDAKEMDIWRIRPSGGTPERLTNHNSDVRYPAPLDNRTILYVSPDQNGAGPWLWALDTDRKVVRRISSGLEVYSSIDASGDGSRLVATVSHPTANLFSIPILDRPAEEKDVKPLSMPTVRAYAPRYGGASLFYLSSPSGGDGLWRYDNGQVLEIWRGADGALFEPPAVAFDGRRAAVILRKGGKRTLNVLSTEGGGVTPLAPAIEVTSAASWSPDGNSIVAAGDDGRGPGLFKIPPDGGAPQRLTTGPASNPLWSPDGSVIVYTGPVVSSMGPLLMIHPDGTAVDATPLGRPAIRVRVNTEHYRFMPGRQELVYVPTTSQTEPEHFYSLDLVTKKTRQITTFDARLTRTFDITPDGKQIVFDRLREKSDIVLIDLPKKP